MFFPWNRDCFPKPRFLLILCFSALRCFGYGSVPTLQKTTGCLIVETCEYHVPLFCWFTLLCSYVAIAAIQPSRSGQSDATKKIRIKQNAFGNSCMPFEVKQWAGHRVKRRHVRFVAHSRGGEFQTHVFFLKPSFLYVYWKSKHFWSLTKQTKIYMPGGIFRFPLPCLTAGT